MTLGHVWCHYAADVHHVQGDDQGDAELQACKAHLVADEGASD